MIKKTQEDYIEELAKLYPEIEEESLKAVIKAGNKVVMTNIKKVHSTIGSRAESKIDDTGAKDIYFFKYKHLTKNNKHAFNKRRADAKQRDSNK